VNWTEGSLTFLAAYCQKECIGGIVSSPIREIDTEDSCNSSSEQVIEEFKLAELKCMEIAMIDPEELTGIPREYHDFLDVFDTEKACQYPETRGEFNFKIELLKDTPLPKPSKAYRLTPGELKEAQKQLKELEEAGMIEDSDSPLATPLFFVPKKDGTQRMCIDYRKLNEITVRDTYPLPNMEQLLEAARGTKVFLKFNLRSVYNMFPLQDGNRWKTAFVTPFGLKQFMVMHYRFINAPACLQRYMDHILGDLIRQQPVQVSAYMDDTGSFAENLEQAVRINRRILKAFRQNKLYCKVSKCKFHKDRMELLGVTINGDGLGLEDKKVSAIQDWPVPRNLKEMKGFIGFCNFYRRFLKNFSIVACPLHKLDKKGTPWFWGPSQQQAFTQLKRLIAEEPCLRHVHLDKTFCMETDASDFAYRAALSQKQEDGKYHPVGFMSKSMLQAERNYDAYDKEALGIVKPLQHWRYWLQGTKLPIEIITDHKNLLSGFNDKPTPSKRHL
jgi:RNase H-like domain found in reverse transcriptase/Reverse transcriptase (RNA-dependent DNA polymerase)